MSSRTPEERIALVTCIRSSNHFWKIKAVHNVDECLLALDGDSTRCLVLRNDPYEAVTNCRAADAWCVCTHAPAIGVSIDGDVIHKKPVGFFASGRVIFH